MNLRILDHVSEGQKSNFTTFFSLLVLSDHGDVFWLGTEGVKRVDSIIFIQ